ncbi:OmpA family protein [Nonlabens ulvanivorans]|uniref:OmpA family protein n=1 Tax=Nonlabens ulvanivorans TaxID=906888 RepID=UPI003D66336B
MFLSENPSKKVYVYAYPDTVGNATDNFNIGKDNVNTARRLMIQNGITSNRIVSISKGEESSGATGNNRSIVVIVK